MDIAILKEIDKISKKHLKNCPCLDEEIELTARSISVDSIKELEENKLVKSSPSVGLDIISQNKGRALEVVSGKHHLEPCPLQTEYATTLWDGFSNKYNIKEANVSLIVGRIIVLALQAYKLSGVELISTGYDKYGNESVEIHDAVEAGRKHSETLVKIIKSLDELENGQRITLRTELPSQNDLFNSDRYVIIDVEEKKEEDL